MEPSYTVFVTISFLCAAIWGFFYWRRHASEKAFQPDAANLAPKLNPLAGMTFDDALDGEKFSTHVRGAIEKALLESAIGSGIHVDRIEVLTEPGSSGGLVVSFGKQLADGNVGGGSFELVRSAQGSYKAIARAGLQAAELGDVDLIAVWLRRFAAGTTAVVSVANVISGADAARKLGAVLKGQEQMFAYRSVDQFAGLRTTYEQLREELGKDLPSVDTLETLRHRLREIRHALMGEVKADLARLDYLYPEHTGLLAKPRKTWDAISKRGGSEAHTARVQALSEFRGKLLLARKCLDFEQIAAASAGVAESQAILLSEAETELQALLPRYQELDEEVSQEETMYEVLADLFRP